MPRVSIVIPNFNQHKYLPACVDHCWFQTHADLELIIVDGGSTDGTKEYLRQLPDELNLRESNPITHMDEAGNIIHKRCRSFREDTHASHPDRILKIIVSEADLGRTGTYNAGFAQVTGEFCTYIVGDDLPHPHMIEELAAALEATGADLAYSDFNIISDDDRIMRLVRKPDYGFKACFADWFHIGVSTLHRANWLKKTGLMDESFQFANDYAHYLRMAMHGARFVHVPRVLYSVRFHGAMTQHEESARLVGLARDFLAQGGVEGGAAPSLAVSPSK